MQILMQMHAEHERQVSLLAARGRRWNPGEGAEQGFVVGPELEGAPS